MKIYKCLRNGPRASQKMQLDWGTSGNGFSARSSQQLHKNVDFSFLGFPAFLAGPLARRIAAQTPLKSFPRGLKYRRRMPWPSSHLEVAAGDKDSKLWKNNEISENMNMPCGKNVSNENIAEH